MPIPRELFKRFLELTDPRVNLDNIQDVAQSLTQTNPNLAKLVHDKCHRFLAKHDYASSAEEMSIPAIQLIITGLEERHLGNPTPAGSYCEDELVQVLKVVDNEVLTAWWNGYSDYNGWTFTDQGTDDPNMHPFLKYRHGWLVRGEERITVSQAIGDILVASMKYIEYWIHRYTKTIFLNTTTEEWTMVFRIDPTDHKAVEQMHVQLRLILMGEKLDTPA